MMTGPAPLIAIACGGTGGHLFPGLAVAVQLAKRGCTLALIVSPKEVDQQSLKNAPQEWSVITLPAVGLQGGNYVAFGASFLKSLAGARRAFRQLRPAALLAMGGFTGAAPLCAARSIGAKTFVHESNTIPGKANRWLARWVDQAFVGFPQAGSQLSSRRVVVTGTPVRPQFQSQDPVRCRKLLGLDSDRPVLLVMGGSQGARGVNELVLATLPLLARKGWQLLHLTGPNDAEKASRACKAAGVKAVVHPFLSEMEIALGAATVAVSRAGASSLAEIAAMRLPTVLVPYPAATDNHQEFNARAFVETGAARLLEQGKAAPEMLAKILPGLFEDSSLRQRMQTALAAWHSPKAAEQIAESMLQLLAQSGSAKPRHRHRSSCGCNHSAHRHGVGAKEAA
jgi:UDP-N-acetylglucosamine--N-acetylmuramyl-(pentapeptide) pyrophosphoryl-undecaprenol N-acetylglucosamine transferase